MNIKRSDCTGCRDDFYNHNNMGANMKTGQPQCWMFSDAVLVAAKDIPISMPPPYKRIKPTKRPNCYKASGYVRVKPENLTAGGYWK